LSSRQTILLADDVNFFLTLEKSFLQREEIDILTAANGRQAYDLTVLHRPDVILLDLYMPEMNGDECCQLLKNDPELSKIPVIMVTTAGKEEEQEKCRLAGCDDIMLKPIHRRIFLETVRRYLKVVERAAPRMPVRMQVMHGNQKRLADYTVNLSTGGLFLETNHPLTQDEPLSLEFNLPGKEGPVTCRGLVAWVNSEESPCNPNLPPGMGIKFVDLDLENLHQIRAFLQNGAADPE